MMQNIENLNLATPTVSEANSRVRFRVRQEESAPQPIISPLVPRDEAMMLLDRLKKRCREQREGIPLTNSHE